MNKQFTHTIGADTDESFKTAAGAHVAIHDANYNGKLEVTLMDDNGREQWTWSRERVTHLLWHEHLIPSDSHPHDYLVEA